MMQDLGAAQGRLLLQKDAGAARVLVGQDAIRVLESRDLLVALRSALLCAHARIRNAAREQLLPLLNRAVKELLLGPQPFFGGLQLAVVLRFLVLESLLCSGLRRYRHLRLALVLDEITDGLLFSSRSLFDAALEVPEDNLHEAHDSGARTLRPGVVAFETGVGHLSVRVLSSRLHEGLRGSAVEVTENVNRFLHRFHALLRVGDGRLV